jgi:hypothetical protein
LRPPGRDDNRPLNAFEIANGHFDNWILRLQPQSNGTGNALGNLISGNDVFLIGRAGRILFPVALEGTR